MLPLGTPLSAYLVVSVLRFVPGRRLCFGAAPLLFLFLLPAPSVAQERGDAPDTGRRPPADTTQRAPTEPGRQAPPGSSGRPSASQKGVTFSAKDSLVIVTHPDSGSYGALYGQAQIAYQKATLKGPMIEMNLQTSVLRASGFSSDTAARARPSFQRGQGQSFTGKILSFNLRTKRGRIVAARTQQRGAYVEGEAVKVFEDSTLFVKNGTYTTCNCPPGQTPSYSLHSDRMKVKDPWVFTGPIQLYLYNIPTPLWLPFGIVPNIPGRRSGPLAPRYGQDRRRGLFLQDLGWYFALNDYTDLQIQASIWSKGSFEINPIFRYRKRYAYQGNLNLTYQRTQIGEEEDPNFVNRHEGRLRWRHNQELSPTASIQGNIDLVTSSDFARRNPTSYDDAVRQEISSSVRYSRDWPGGGKSLTISANQHQQLQSGTVRLTLPNVNFSQRSFKPFEVEQAVGEERWYEKITTSYEFSLENQYSFRPRDPEALRARGDSLLADSLERANISNISWYEALVDRRKYQLATGNKEPFDVRATHRIPLSASFRASRYNLNLNPRIQYSSDWHISTKRRFVRRDTIEVSEDSTRIEKERIERTVRGFYARRTFSTGLSANTELYGLFPLHIGPLEGLRHRMVPSLSFRYKPNFNAPFWGRTRTLRFENGQPVIDPQTGEPIRYDILDGRPVRGSNEQRSLHFSIDNELETKYVRVDSTGKKQEEEIKLLDFDLGSSYNFAAEDFKMSNIDVRARTTIQDFRVSTNMTFSPYALRRRENNSGPLTSKYMRVDRYMIAENPLTPARLTQFQLNVSGSFRSQQRGGRPSGNRRPGQRPRGQRRSPQSPRRSQSPPPTPKGYLDANLPWSLNFNFSYGFRKPGKRLQTQNATLNTRFTLDVTPLWSLRGRTGYDLINNELATTQINLQRDLGCWIMSFSWVPFGRYQSYSFTLQVESGHLSQLLRLQIPNSGRGGRLGGFGNRLRGVAGRFMGRAGQVGGPF